MSNKGSDGEMDGRLSQGADAFDDDVLSDETLLDEMLLDDAPFEAAEVQRLADLLEALDAGEPPAVNGREDPELAALVSTTALLRQHIADATGSASFESYHARSRAYILHTLESDDAAAG